MRRPQHRGARTLARARVGVSRFPLTNRTVLPGLVGNEVNARLSRGSRSVNGNQFHMTERGKRYPRATSTTPSTAKAAETSTGTPGRRSVPNTIQDRNMEKKISSDEIITTVVTGA